MKDKPFPLIWIGEHEYAKSIAYELAKDHLEVHGAILHCGPIKEESMENMNRNLLSQTHPAILEFDVDRMQTQAYDWSKYDTSTFSKKRNRKCNLKSRRKKNKRAKKARRINRK